MHYTGQETKTCISTGQTDREGFVFLGRRVGSELDGQVVETAAIPAEDVVAQPAWKEVGRGTEGVAAMNTALGRRVGTLQRYGKVLCCLKNAMDTSLGLCD